MSIEVDIYEKIRYLHEHEGKSQRVISKLLGISRNTVKKYCEGSQVPWERQGISGRQRYVVTDEVMEFIKSCLATDTAENIKKQKHTAKRIYDRLVDEKDFNGGESTIREIVAGLKDKQAKVFVPLSYDPGEAIQIDWGEATAYISGKKIKVNLFCMRECYSADMFCKAFYRQNEESFIEAQITGFNYFEGAPKRIIFDNAKVAVKEGFGVHAKVQDKYKALAAHYAFQCDFCNIAAGHEKGLVEGLVGWVRRNILVPIPRVETIDELNSEILRRCLKYREHKIAGREQTVGEMALTTRVRLTMLPRYKFDSSKSITQRVSDFSTVRFDYNHYSVPVKYANKEISVKGYGNEVVMIYRNAEIARYSRCYERGQTKYRLEHYIDLIEKRPRSVFNAKPVKNNLSIQLLEAGRRLSGPREMVKLLRLCVDYGEDKVLAAIGSLKNPELSVELIRAFLTPVNTPEKIPIAIDIQVPKPQFDKYNALMNRGAVV
ncbi:IS21 family transposase [Desulfosporosinus nitroreducens]|uniref:IS21 family transposase n=1 Tax=Desulfosporosinus nitroreducens TaxID=2018668 RepID=A0ABT8R1B6_9FIRM|nr:IS21 family transposase [Desulfosporosinus nitroreducens]MDO0826083.1 IS21 family transposase [Desulfosporosinus nitroreducens]